jgi:hypothetical protein
MPLEQFQKLEIEFQAILDLLTDTTDPHESRKLLLRLRQLTKQADEMVQESQ